MWGNGIWIFFFFSVNNLNIRNVMWLHQMEADEQGDSMERLHLPWWQKKGLMAFWRRGGQKRKLCSDVPGLGDRHPVLPKWKLGCSKDLLGDSKCALVVLISLESFESGSQKSTSHKCIWFWQSIKFCWSRDLIWQSQENWGRKESPKLKHLAEQNYLGKMFHLPWKFVRSMSCPSLSCSNFKRDKASFPTTFGYSYASV